MSISVQLTRGYPGSTPISLVGLELMGTTTTEPLVLDKPIGRPSVWEASSGQGSVQAPAQRSDP